MKKVVLSAAVLACGLIFNGCNKVANKLAQSIGWDGVDITIDVPPTTAVGSYATVGTGTFVYNFDSLIKAKTSNALGMSNIDEFKFTSCVLTILNPSSTNSFGDFSAAKASFSTNYNTTTALLGEITSNPDVMSSSLTIPVNTTTNMRPYLPSSGLVTINYDLSGNMRRVRTTTTKVNVHITYNIHVTP